MTQQELSSPTATLCVTTENHADVYDRVEVGGMDGGALSLSAILQLDSTVEVGERVEDMCPGQLES